MEKAVVESTKWMKRFLTYSEKLNGGRFLVTLPSNGVARSFKRFLKERWRTAGGAGGGFRWVCLNVSPKLFFVLGRFVGALLALYSLAWSSMIVISGGAKRRSWGPQEPVPLLR